MTAERVSILSLIFVFAIGVSAYTQTLDAIPNATAFPGVDVGAKVNAAIAQLPTYAIGAHRFHFGTVRIPQANLPYVFSTTIRLPPTVLLRCDSGAVLTYRGDGDAINQQAPYPLNNVPLAMGGVEGCQFAAPPKPAPDVNVIHTGDAVGMHYRDIHIDGYEAPGDTAILIENHIYFIKHTQLSGLMLTNNTHGLVFKRNCGTNRDCEASFEYSDLEMYCATSYTRAGDCLSLQGGAIFQHEHVNVRANIVSSGSSLIRVDKNSQYYQNADTLLAEGDAQGTSLVYSEAASNVQLNGLIQAGNLSNNPPSLPIHTTSLTMELTIPGTYTMVFPGRFLDARIWGAGGGGGGGSKSGKGLGGGQGAFVDCQFNSPQSATYTIVVGAGGEAGAIDHRGGDGGASSVSWSTSGCSAKGGAGGGTTGGTAGIGGTANSTTGPALASFIGGSASGQSPGGGMVPGYCPCGGRGGDADAPGKSGDRGIVLIQRR